MDDALHQVAVTVNGRLHRRTVERRLLLSDFIRQDLLLTGTHVGCEHGVCGACTILFDGEPARSCIMLAVQADGHEIRRSKGWHPAKRPASAPGGDSRTPRAAVRLLHAGLPDDAHGVPRDTPRRPRPRSARRCPPISVAAPATSTSSRRCCAPPENDKRTGMTTRYFGAPIKRNEDAAADRAARSSWTTCSCRACCTWRSCAASTRTRAFSSVDVSAARSRPGVVAVYTAGDLGDYWQPGSAARAAAADPRHLVFHPRTQLPLARDKVRYVGEPIAMIVAESRYLAEDALARRRRRHRSDRRRRRSRKGACARRAARPRAMSARTSPRTSCSSKGDYAQARGARRSSWCAGGFSTTAARRRRSRIARSSAQWDAQREGADDLGHDAGADSDSQRPGGTARTARVAGARRSRRSSAAASVRRS